MSDNEFYIGQLFTGTYPPEAAVFCNNDGTIHIDEIEPDDQGNRQFIIVKNPEPTIDEIAETARQKRNSLIVSTDYLLMTDYPIDEETRQAVIEYRQNLRDVPQQDGFPTDIIWPVLDESIAKILNL